MKVKHAWLEFEKHQRRMGQNYRREGKGWDQNENLKEKTSSVISTKRE